jgi:hypothetical protein
LTVVVLTGVDVMGPNRRAQERERAAARAAAVFVIQRTKFRDRASPLMRFGPGERSRPFRRQHFEARDGAFGEQRRPQGKGDRSTPPPLE